MPDATPPPDAGTAASPLTDDVLHRLEERVKELTALHRTARLLQDPAKSPAQVLADVVRLLPGAWQYPEITSARIRFAPLEAVTEPFTESPWRQAAAFATRDGQSGSIEVFYREARPTADEGPFLKEERDLIESLAEMLRAYFQHQRADHALRQAHAELERQVDARTEELRRTNEALHEQIRQDQVAQGRIAAYQQQLRDMAAQLALTEARERRAIAEDLHDHIGQALSFIKMSVSQFRGNAIFCGFEGEIDRIMSLLDQTIRYTRDLTFEISPPVLYELGLPAALEWLAERFHKRHDLAVTIQQSGTFPPLSDDVRFTLLKSVQELLTNVVKHAQAGRATVRLHHGPGQIEIEVADDGRGFDPAGVDLVFRNVSHVMMSLGYTFSREGSWPTTRGRSFWARPNVPSWNASNVRRAHLPG
jgi:signal transduction histidine kinase